MTRAEFEARLQRRLAAAPLLLADLFLALSVVLAVVTIFDAIHG